MSTENDQLRATILKLQVQRDMMQREADKVAMHIEQAKALVALAKQEHAVKVMELTRAHAADVAQAKGVAEVAAWKHEQARHDWSDRFDELDARIEELEQENKDLRTCTKTLSTQASSFDAERTRYRTALGVFAMTSSWTAVKYSALPACLLKEPWLIAKKGLEP